METYWNGDLPFGSTGMFFFKIFTHIVAIFIYLRLPTSMYTLNMEQSCSYVFVQVFFIFQSVQYMLVVDET